MAKRRRKKGRRIIKRGKDVMRSILASPEIGAYLQREKENIKAMLDEVVDRIKKRIDAL